MSVLVEAYTVIMRRSRLERIHPAAVEQFFKNAPNQTPRADDHLVAISFMHPEDVRIYIRTLEQEAGLRHLEDSRCVDIAVVDQALGSLAPCDWLEVSADERGVAFSWLKGTAPGEIALYKSWRWDGKPRMQRSEDSGALSQPDRFHERTFDPSHQRLVDGRDKMHLVARRATFDEFRRRGWQACAVLRAHNPVHHLVLRRENRLALVYVEADDETRLDESRKRKLLDRAKAWRAEPVLSVCNVHSPVWIKGGKVDHFDEPLVEKIRLIDLSSGRALDEKKFDYRTPIEVSDWEVLDFAIQVVREHLEQDGYAIDSWTSETNEGPHIEATKEGVLHYIVVAGGRYPESQPIIDRNRMIACAERAMQKGARLARAIVGLANSDDMFVGDFPLPLWRGNAAVARFQGLEFVEPEMVSADREVRFFVSSTFQDFRAERKLILQEVVPELNRRAHERDVYVTAVDLQWGVTEADARNSLQLANCLREVERCSPFLVGLLGDRYGWIPTPLAVDNAQASAEWHGMSITEMEIRRALLPDYQANRSGLVYAKKGYDDVRRRREALTTEMARQPALESQLRTLKRHGLFVGEATGGKGRYVKPPLRRNSSRPFESLLVDLVDRGIAVQSLGRDFEKRVVKDAWELIDKHFPVDPDFDPASRLVRRHRHYGFGQAQAFDPNWPKLTELADAARQMRTTKVGFSNSWEATGVAGIVARSAREAVVGARVFEFHCGLCERESLQDELLGALLVFLGGVLDRRMTVPLGSEARLALLEQMLEVANGESAPVLIVVSESDLLSGRAANALRSLREAKFTRLIETYTDSSQGTIWSEEERCLFLKRAIRRRGRDLEQAKVERIVTHPLSTNLLFLQFVVAFLSHWADHKTLGETLSRALRAMSWEDVADLVRLDSEVAGRNANAAVQELARKLSASANGVDPLGLIDDPALSGRALFEARSRMEFLIAEWGGRWRFNRGADAVVSALMA